MLCLSEVLTLIVIGVNSWKRTLQTFGSGRVSTASAAYLGGVLGRPNPVAKSAGRPFRGMARPADVRVPERDAAATQLQHRRRIRRRCLFFDAFFHCFSCHRRHLRNCRTLFHQLLTKHLLFRRPFHGRGQQWFTVPQGSQHVMRSAEYLMDRFPFDFPHASRKQDPASPPPDLRCVGESRGDSFAGRDLHEFSGVRSLHSP
jgi:hypothetical protein